MVHKSISGHTAAGMSRQQSDQIGDLFTIFLYKQIAFLDTIANMLDCGNGNFREIFIV